jgi:hypothetical protein
MYKMKFIFKMEKKKLDFEYQISFSFNSMS